MVEPMEGATTAAAQVFIFSVLVMAAAVVAGVFPPVVFKAAAPVLANKPIFQEASSRYGRT